MKMSSTDGYLTDTCSLDALSEHEDDMTIGNEEQGTPVGRTKVGISNGNCTPTPLFSMLDIHTPVAAPPTERPDPKIVYFVGQELLNDRSLLAAAEELGLEVRKDVLSEATANSYDWYISIVVFSDFSGSFFDSLRRRYPSQRPRIFGPAAILATAQSKEKRLPQSRLGYPIYSTHLLNCRVAATGISSKEHLQEIRRKILYMGGTYSERRSERLPVTDGVATHLIAGKCRGTKYQDAVSLGKPILKPEWVDHLWSQRDNIYFSIDCTLAQYKVKCFHACCIAFYGFSAAEKAEMTKLVLENGGTVVEPDDPKATHIVKGDGSEEATSLALAEFEGSPSLLVTPVQSIPRTVCAESSETDGGEPSPLKRGRFELDVVNDINETEAEAAKQAEFASERAKVLKVEWFWNSIQIEACSEERLYLLDGRSSVHCVSFDLDHTIRSIGTPGSFTSPLGPVSDTDGTPKSAGTPGSTGRRKRKRMREYVSSLAHVDYPRFISEPHEESGVPNLGGSSLDYQEKDVVSDAEFAQILKELSMYLKSADVKTMTRRQIEFYQLLETERNYVTVLMNIVKIFKEPCENEDQPGGRILNVQEIKTIFSTMLPIFSTHRRLLRDLFRLQATWNEDTLIGKVYFDYAGELQKFYEPYVNFFESVKNEIARCELEKPRFMALLRIAQGRPECGKQSLSELIIRPVQRLPSTALILTNLAKHTPKTNPDSEWITKGLEALNQCILKLNEGKAKNEARVAIFESYSEVDGCPAKTISNHRTLLSKIDVTALCDLWGQKFDPLTLFVYTDHVQITKRKGHGHGLSGHTSGKPMSAGVSMANLRSPSVGRKSFVPGAMMNHHPSQQKKYKFCEWIDFTEIKRVLDVFDTSTPSFAFVVRGPRDLRERILVFTCPEDPEWPKEKLLIFLAKQLANAVNRVDFDNLIAKADSASLNINENQATVLEKAARFATKTRHKVGRALSLNRTPSKLKRTMSQMMSPFTSHRHRVDPDSISQLGGDSPPPAAKLPTYGDWK